MRFRPANIRLINRRHYLPRLLLPLSSHKRNGQRTLTGHYISGKYRRQYIHNALKEGIGPQSQGSLRSRGFLMYCVGTDRI
jgi:hypothetical protein